MGWEADLVKDLTKEMKPNPSNANPSNADFLKNYSAKQLSQEITIEGTALHFIACHGTLAQLSAVIEALGPEATRVAALSNQQGKTPLKLALENEKGTLFPFIELLGNDYKNLLGPLENLSPDEKKKVSSGILVMLEVFLDRLEQGHTLSDKQMAFCVDHKDQLENHPFYGKNPQKLGALFQKKGWKPTLIEEIKSKKRDVTFLEKYSPKQLARKLTPEGWTALHLAAQYGTPYLLLMLAKKLGSDAPRLAALPEEGEGYTPFHIAACYGTNVSLSMLSSIFVSTAEAARVAALPDKQGRTALHIAAMRLPFSNQHTPNPKQITQRFKKHTDVIRMLINILGSDAPRVAALPTKNGWTPLRLAAYSGVAQSISELIQALGPTDAPTQAAQADQHGQTSLYLAAACGTAESVSELIQCLGQEAPRIAALAAKNGLTPLQGAIQNQKECNLPPLIEVLGIDYKKSLASFETLTSDTKKKIEAAIPVVFERFLQHLTSAQPLHDRQINLCNEDPKLFRSLFLTFHKSNNNFLKNITDTNFLEKVIDKEHSLGTVFWAQKLNTTSKLFYNDTPPIIRDIQKQLNRLKKANKTAQKTAGRIYSEGFNNAGGL